MIIDKMFLLMAIELIYIQMYHINSELYTIVATLLVLFEKKRKKVVLEY